LPGGRGALCRPGVFFTQRSHPAIETKEIDTMKARKLILTAGVVVALAGPATQTAGAMIPTDGGGSRPRSVALKEIKATLHQNKKAQDKKTKSSATAISASTYSAYAYVQGGASKKVATAITKAGKRLAKTHVAPVSDPRPVVKPAVSGGATGSSSGSGIGTSRTGIDSDPNACLQSSICTPLELCTIWGMGCMELEQPGPAIEVAATSDQLPATDSSATGSSATSPTLLGADATDTSSLYQDC
jgi:hypothetical protein